MMQPDQRCGIFGRAAAAAAAEMKIVVEMPTLVEMITAGVESATVFVMDLPRYTISGDKL